MLSRVKTSVKRALLGVSIVIVALGLTMGFVVYSAFAHNKAIVDRQVPVPGVEIVKDGFVSVAMLDAGPEKVALIDAGNDKEAKAILSALAERKLSPSSVVAIFLTHGHGDHTAGCRVFGAVPVYAMQDELPQIGKSVVVTHPLRDGDVTEIGDLRVEAFATPGHTAGSAVYFARGVLFFGDSAGGAQDGAMMPAVRFFSKDPNRNIASLKNLAARLQPRAAEVKMLAFAHSGPLESFQPLASFASTH